MRPGFVLPPLMFTEQELEALALGGLWVKERADPELVTAAADALAKIAAVLPVPLTATLDHSPLVPGRSKMPVQDVIEPKVIRSAIRTQKKLRIIYADETGTRTDRVVWPIALVYYEAVRLVVAWCEMRKAFRHFRSDRISELVLLDDRYPKSRTALTQAWREQEAAEKRAIEQARKQDAAE
jgi:predicted DNA-binding transcriptional regulator YafY